MREQPLRDPRADRSSSASRQRQRQRRRARKKLWDAQKDLAERQVDLVGYNRVIADMAKRELSPIGGQQAIAIVRVCRDMTEHDCDRLLKIVADLENAVEKAEKLS